MFVNFVWLPNLANIFPCCVILIQIIHGKCIFSHSLAKLAYMVQDKKVDKHTPPAEGGFDPTNLKWSHYIFRNTQSIEPLSTVWKRWKCV